MQYDKECFSIGTFIPSNENPLEELLSFLEMILGSSPQFLKIFKNISILNEQVPVLYKQSLRAVALSQSTQEDLFPVSTPPVWELSYIGSKVEEISDREKDYGILVYNISDSMIYEDPQTLVGALGYRKIYEYACKRVIHFEMQERDYKLLVNIKPWFENEEGLLVVCGEKEWEKDEIKRDFKSIKQARVELIVKCQTEGLREVLSIFSKIILKLRRFIKFEQVVTDDFISKE